MKSESHLILPANAFAKKLFVTFMVALGFLGASSIPRPGSAEAHTRQDPILYGALYDCPRSSVRNFKVLRCGDNDWCDVFFVNSSPEGGYKDEMRKSKILELLRIGCTVNGRPAPAAKSEGDRPAAGDTETTRGASSDNKKEATAQPQAGTDDCPFNETPGKVTATAKASEGLFKRVIYERYRDMESGRRVGVTFLTFRLANSFVNRLTNNGLLHDGAPQGATVYRYKTDYFVCVRYTDSILRTEVKEGYFACFKDKSGDWACAEDGRRKWDQKYLPVK